MRNFEGKNGMCNAKIGRLVIPVISSFLLLVSLSLPANAAIFVKIDGIEGESTDANHDKWIDVLSVSESISRPDSGATGQSRRRGSAVFDDIVIKKELDLSSVKLRERLAQGQVIPKVEIEITGTFGGSRATYFKYELKNVQITSFSVNASGSSDSRPAESFSLNFEEIKWTYTQYDSEGNKLGNVEATWKVEEGTQ